MTRVHVCAFALLALGGCGGIDIDIPEWETGDVDGGLDIGGDLAGDLDDGWTSNPDDGNDDGGNDDGDNDDGGNDDGDVDGDDGDGGDVETSVADDGTDDGPIFGECCDAHDEPGCDDHEISACVCEVDPWCCEMFWDQICVDEVSDLGCGLCEGQDDGPTDDGDDDVGDDEIGDDDVGEVGSSEGDDGNDDGGPAGPCCEAHDGGGCEYPEVAACVCEADPFCCKQVWDELCVAQVDMLECGVCGSLDEGGTDDGSDDDGTDDGSDDDGGGTGACCEAHASAGCEYPEVADCVCLFDAFCCDVTWDDICVDEVESFACGICS